MKHEIGHDRPLPNILARLSFAVVRSGCGRTRHWVLTGQSWRVCCHDIRGLLQGIT